MRGVARLSLSRLAPVLWLGAVAHVGLLAGDPDWGKAIARPVIGSLLLTAAAAIAATVCRQVEKSIGKSAEITADRIHCRCLTLLADALLATQPSDDDPESGACGLPALRVVDQ